MTHLHQVSVLILFGLLPLGVHAQVANIQIATREWDIRGWKETDFLSIMGMDVVGPQSLVVSDKLNNVLVRVDRGGRIRGARQKKGTTKGGFNGPGTIAVGCGLIAVVDFASNRIQLFNESLDPVAEIRAPGPVFALAVDRRGDLWVGAFGGSNGESLFKYDPSGQELFRSKTQSPARGIFDGVFHLAGKDTLWLVYATRNLVERWDADGHPLGVFAVSGFPLGGRSPKEDNDKKQYAQAPPNILFVTCTEIGPGRLAVLAGDVAAQPRQEVYTVNTRGEIVGFFTLPHRASLVRFLDPQHVISIEQRKTVVACYRLNQLQ